jgi:PleD family two-component response regulator
MSARGHEVRLTAGVGVASLTELESSEDPVANLLAFADARMYRAKTSGRSRMCFVDLPLK